MEVTLDMVDMFGEAVQVCDGMFPYGTAIRAITHL